MKGSLYSVQSLIALGCLVLAVLTGSQELAGGLEGDDPGAIASAVVGQAALNWHSYGERFAIIVMGGHVTGPPHYQWYWGDTGGMYHELLYYGFRPENVCFLSYGDSAVLHPDWVDTVSTVACVAAAFHWAQTRCTPDDLLYIYWVDHGTATHFYCHDDTLSHSELGALIEPIVARAIIGAYNPCHSGCVIDDVSRAGVITVTSQDCDHPNSWGWAGKWRRALRGAAQDSVDADQDGHISMAEAYGWIAPQSQAAGEHSMLDDNGDGAGHEWNREGYSPEDPAQDGCYSRLYSLDGWADTAAGDTAAVEAWPSTQISYIVPKACHAEIIIHDSRGRKIRTLVSERQSAGKKTVYWDGTDDRGHPAESGIYLLTIEAGGATDTRKIVLMR